MRWSLALVVLAGCSAIYGLDGVKNDDPDDDHIPSSIDNCPTVYNPDQSDINGDMIGDACQVCGATDPTDSDGDGIPDQCDGCDNRLPDNNGNGIPDACEHPHDEDGDGIPDFRDNCPSVANAGQADTMDGGPGAGVAADGVGDACDDSSGIDRQLFDAFADENQLWVVDGADWTIANDQANVPLTPNGVYRYAGFAHGSFTVRTHVTLASSGSVSIVITNNGPGATEARVTCSINASSGNITVIVRGATSGNYLAASPYKGTGSDDDLSLYVYPNPDGSLSLACSTALGGGLTAKASFAVTNWTPGLGGALEASPTTSNASVSFDYFDVVTSGP